MRITCDSPKHYLTAARMTATTLGHKLAAVGDPLDEAACIRRGEAGMGRPAERYAAWLEIAEGHGFFRTTMFITHKGQQISASTVVPLKPEAFDRVCAGELGDHNLAQANLTSPSTYLLIAGMTDSEIRPHTARAILRAIEDDLLPVRLFLAGNRPLLSDAGNLVSNSFTRQLLQRVGFVEIGSSYYGTSFPIVVFRDPGEIEAGNVQARIAYTLIVTSFRLYAIANQQQWDEEDSAARLRSRSSAAALRAPEPRAPP